MSLSPDQAVAILESGPERIRVATVGVAPDLLRAAPEPGEWSVVEVLAHLRACADVWGGAIGRMLGEAHPTIRAVNPRTWIDETDYPDLELAPSLDAFAAQRAELLGLLRALAPEQWARSATVTGAGRPLEKTVLDYADRLARHERSHLGQIERTVAAVTS